MTTDLRATAPARPARVRRASTLVAGALGLALLVSTVPVTASAVDAPAPRRIVTGWMPYWSTAASTASVVANADLFTEVSPFWYSAQWSGGRSVITEQVSASSKADALARVRAAGIKVVPAITDGMPPKQLAAVLANATTRAAFVAQLVDLVVSNGYAGLDLDFEKFAFSDGRSTWSSTRPSWVAFVAALSGALHAEGKLLSVTTPPIYDAGQSSSSGYWVYDWAGIARYVDRLRIMAYDYSVSVPGPIAPFAWVEKIVAFAVTQAPPGKIQIGVPSYGRDWVRRNAANKYLVEGTCPVDNVPDYSKKEFTAATVPSVLAARGLTAASVTWNATYREQTFRYSKVYAGTNGAGAATSCTVFREAWYDDGRAATARATLVGKYQLAGIAQWTIGGEDPAQWASLRAYARTIAPTPTSVVVVAPAYVGFRQPLTVAARGVSAGLPVVDASATLFFRRLGTTTWIRMADSRTGADGRVSFRSVLPGHGDYRVYVGGTYERAAGAANTRVTAKSVLTVSPSAASVRPGSTVNVTVTTLPRITKQVLVRQVLVKGRWVTAAKAVAPRSGVVVFPVKPLGRYTTYTMRIVAVATAGYASGVATFTVRVR